MSIRQLRQSVLDLPAIYKVISALVLLASLFVPVMRGYSALADTRQDVSILQSDVKQMQMRSVGRDELAREMTEIKQGIERIDEKLDAVKTDTSELRGEMREHTRRAH